MGIIFRACYCSSLGYAHWPERTSPSLEDRTHCSSLGYAHWPEPSTSTHRAHRDCSSLGYAHWPEQTQGKRVVELNCSSLGYAHWPELRRVLPRKGFIVAHWDMRTGRNARRCTAGAAIL